MSRSAAHRIPEQGRRPTAKKRFGSDRTGDTELIDDIEREFLKPVARYLAILQEWSLERLSDGTGNVPHSE